MNRPSLYLTTVLSLAAMASPAFADLDIATMRANAAYRAAAANYAYEVVDNWRDKIGRGERESVTVQLVRGVRYAIFAGADENIDDLDIEVYDATGARVAWNQLDDDVPVVELRPSYTSTYTIVVTNAGGTRGWFHLALAL